MLISFNTFFIAHNTSSVNRWFSLISNLLLFFPSFSTFLLTLLVYWLNFYVRHECYQVSYFDLPYPDNKFTTISTRAQRGCGTISSIVKIFLFQFECIYCFVCFTLFKCTNCNITTFTLGLPCKIMNKHGKPSGSGFGFNVPARVPNRTITSKN